MLTNLLIKYWRESIIGLLIATIIVGWWFKNVQIKEAEAEAEKAKATLSQYVFALDFQNQAIEAQRIDAEKLKNLPKTIERIKDRYIVVYPEIEAIKEDGNATSFYNAINSFVF